MLVDLDITTEAADSLSNADTSSQIPRGQVIMRQLGVDPEQIYYVYWPESAGYDAALFVTVHGISRNAEEHAKRFSSYAERHGVVLVAPLFSQERFPRYQRLIDKNGGQQADLMLLDIVEEVSGLVSVDTSKMYLFGFSGGGQFVHRFAMRHPQRVARYVVAAAGWYTFPDPEQRFPRGIRRNKHLPHLLFDLIAFLTIPGSVIVGERDVKPGTALNRNPKIIAQQGEHRRERGERWIQAMIEAAQQAGLPAHFSFDIAPRCGHSFRRAMRRGNLGELAFTRLFNTTH
jgi:pimeloyl-ACP methyl ester carboxylesterase